MSEPAENAERAPLSVEDAVAHLTAPAAPEQAAASEPDEIEETEAEPTAEDASEPEEATAGEEEAEQAEPEAPAIEPPQFWDAEGREGWSSIPREHQEFILAQVGKQAASASKAIEQAAEARKAAEGQASKVTQLADALNGFLPQAMETFKGRWEGVDWVQAARQLDPQEFNALQAEFQAQQRQLEQLTAANRDAERLAHETHVRTVNEALPRVAPDLTDPVKGQERLGKVFSFLTTQGYAPEQLKHVSAPDLAIAYDAMRWREAQAAPPKPKPQPKPAMPTVKPTATQASNPQQRGVQTAKNRYAQTRSVDDAVALLLSKGT
jgi:hypothetical protein